MEILVTIIMGLGAIVLFFGAMAGWFYLWYKISKGQPWGMLAAFSPVLLFCICDFCFCIGLIVRDLVANHH
jgi:hypothetical protein